MQNYIIDIDFTMSKRIEIEAENEEQAKVLAERMIDAAPYDYACNFSHMVGYKVIDVNEE